MHTQHAEQALPAVSSTRVYLRHYECTVSLHRYKANGQPAIVLNGAPGTNYEGVAVAMATACIPVLTDRKTTAIKDYNENEGVLDALVAAGVVQRTGMKYPSGFVELDIVRLAPEFLAEMEKEAV
jgi:hypothetical protein